MSLKIAIFDLIVGDPLGQNANPITGQIPSNPS